MNQLSLFGDTQTGDDRPLPVLIAEQFGFALQTHVVEGKTYFAVQDWMQALVNRTTHGGSNQTSSGATPNCTQAAYSCLIQPRMANPTRWTMPTR